MTRFDSIDRAIADIAAGKAVVVVDDENRENEGDLVFAAEKATTELLAFMVRHTSGFVCVPLTGEDCDRLALPPMCTINQDKHGTAYTVTVDATAGIGTGISAADRATTIRVLADRDSGAHDLTRPGHVVPLRARDGGVLARAGHTEAAVDLARLAGLRPSGVICEIVSRTEPGAMARADELRAFADEHRLAMIAIADLIAWRRRNDHPLDRTAEARIPTRHGEFTAITYRSTTEASEHLALVMGDVTDRTTPVLVRVHSECLTGDILGSLRCDCGEQLDQALARIGAEGRGILVYLRGHEGRGIGLTAKLRAYSLQDQGMDTVDANLAQGLPVDARSYTAAAHILRDLDVRGIRLLTNNPDKCGQLTDAGAVITRREALLTAPTVDNTVYLHTKRTRLDHHLATTAPLPESLAASN
ncbi:bifunctional 3,4-dihydroxy-2-butanone-4-phosphate synthase/GTP cyclohydrolase II [Rhodococcus sp. NPDC127593]|uniref:bifunctional 3,4-dihydroxy-2-butanone-4-phosphate synthase/GTP cyclohydrolase II n=2 Tax=unclassified Rhodococcus (in: high G+C Gram-positive bacteria) TaxID=192944 RepID=UPI00362856BB